MEIQISFKGVDNMEKIVKAGSSPGVSVPDSENIDFGDKDFSFSFHLPDLPFGWYYNELFHMWQ